MGSVIGHRAVVHLLNRSLQQGRLAHSYLLVGPPHVGKMTVALYLAQAVNCTGLQKPCRECAQCLRVAAGKHADVQVVGLREGVRVTDIAIDQVRELQRAAALKPFEGSCRVFIVDGAERLSLQAANALLKTLEEPPPQVLLLLITTDEEALPPTVASRCQRLELHPQAFQEVAQALEERGVDPQRALALARRSQGCPGVALGALEDETWQESQDEALEELPDLLRSPVHQRFDEAAEMAQRFATNREAVQAQLRQWLEWWRDLLLVKEAVSGYVLHEGLRASLEATAQEVDTAAIARSLRLLQEAQDWLDRNANPRLVLEHLLLGLPALAPRPAPATE